jgi:hypothetical protein
VGKTIVWTERRLIIRNADGRGAERRIRKSRKRERGRRRTRRRRRI